MSDPNKPQGLRTEVIVALIGLIGIISVAVIENWDTVIGQTPNSASPSVSSVATPSSSVSPTATPLEPASNETISPQSPQPGAIAPSATPPSSSAAAPTLADCRITIRHPLVALMREPDRLGQEMINVKPGDYTPLDHKMVSTMVREEGWFQIEAEGRRGWIANDTWTIEEKTQTCP
jgi:hypothetical protein